ncbi:MAG: hypothetical protein ACK4QW_05150 [Alphaproteobacteria bacterium]
MTAHRLALFCIAAGVAVAAAAPAAAQRPDQLSYEETRQCVMEGQRLDKELPAIEAQRPAIERDGAALDRLAQEVEVLRERSAAVIDPALSREYDQARERHYQEYDRYTRDLTAFNRRVADYNNALTAYNRDCAPDRLYGLYLERAQRELGLR